MPIEMCHCGRPLHYTNTTAEASVRKLVDELGTHIEVVVEGRRWRVPRHYIALHGLKASDVDKLGFEEIP